MERRAFMSNMVLSELEDAVGVENVSCNQADKLTYGVDYFWVARMWADKAAEDLSETDSVLEKLQNDYTMSGRLAGVYRESIAWLKAKRAEK